MKNYIGISTEPGINYIKSPSIMELIFDYIFFFYFIIIN